MQLMPADNAKLSKIEFIFFAIVLNKLYDVQKWVMRSYNNSSWMGLSLPPSDGQSKLFALRRSSGLVISPTPSKKSIPGSMRAELFTTA